MRELIRLVFWSWWWWWWEKSDGLVTGEGGSHLSLFGMEPALSSRSDDSAFII